MRRRDLLLAGSAGVAGYGGYRLLRRGSREPAPTATEADPGTARPAGVTRPPRVGGTLNGRPRRLEDDLQLIEQSGTRWLHAFLNPLQKLDADVTPREDPDLRALRRARREHGVDRVVSLKWNFSGYQGVNEPERVPAGGSEREAVLFDYVTRQLRALGEPVAFVVLGNEPVFETADEDLEGQNSALIQFTRRLKTHLRAQYVGDRTDLLVGAFNKLYNVWFWRNHLNTYQDFLEMARSEEGIDGIDLHLHYEELTQVETMLRMIRRFYPEGTVTATEFSPIWRYDHHVDNSIKSFDGGAEFLERHGLPEDFTVVEYYEHAKQDPRPRDEMGDFMQTMDWYNVDFVRDMHDLLDRYDVSLGMIGFRVDDGVTNVTWTEDWRPFQINHLFQPPFIEEANGAHPHYLDDYRELA